MQQYNEYEILVRKKQVLLERIRKNKDELRQSKRRFNKCIKKMIFSFLLIFICYGIVYITDSENFIMYVMFTKTRIAATAFMFVMIIRFFWNFFIFLGEYGMPTFASFFCGGTKGTYAEVKERTTQDIAELYIKVYLIEDELENKKHYNS